MASKTVIDEDILGLEKRIPELKEKYIEIIPVRSIDELPQGIKDEKIGAYCYENGCDLFTTDNTAYVKFFKDARIKSVIITNYTTDEQGKKIIYKIQII